MNNQSEKFLSEILEQEKRLPLQDALSIQNDLLTQLKSVHEAFQPGTWKQPGDIPTLTPDHILISYKGDKPAAVLSQGGDVRSLRPSPDSGHFYLSPEGFWDVYLPASDVFSAGIILYRMITGVFPWKYDADETGDPVTKIFSARKILPRRPSFYNNRCDEYLDAVILKAISTNIEYRYQTADEFLSALTSEKRITETTGDKTSPMFFLEEKKEKKEKKHSETGEKLGGFKDVAGMKTIKDMLYHDVILPLQDKSLYEEYKVTVPNGMLLYGPPGCGKTFISQKFAEEIDYHFVQVKPSDLASIYVHGTQEKIGQLFREAREHAPSIIFIDEVDAVLPNRQGNLYHSYASEVNEFLAQMTECHEQGVFIIAATNCPERIDPAILRTGRMDKVFYVEPPDAQAREEMFRLYIEGRPLETDIDFKRLAELSENYVSSDIKFMVNEASRNALKERVKISQKHIEDVIQKTDPSVSENQLKRYEAFKNSRVFL
jgi:transitional endoplasmic reticulum ATPase